MQVKVDLSVKMRQTGHLGAAVSMATLLWFLPLPAWVSSLYSGSSQSKTCTGSQICGQCECKCRWLFVFLCGPAINCQLVQGVTPYFPWDWCQRPASRRRSTSRKQNDRRIEVNLGHHDLRCKSSWRVFEKRDGSA